MKEVERKTKIRDEMRDTVVIFSFFFGCGWIASNPSIFSEEERDEDVNTEKATWSNESVITASCFPF